MATNDGFAGLGELVAGLGRGPDNTSDAYLSGLQQGYTTQRAGYLRDESREEARIARARAVAFDALPEAVRTAGYDPRFAPLATAVLQANQTVDLNRLGDMAVPGAAGAFYAGAEKLRAGDVPGYNDELAIATGKERKPYALGAGGDLVYRADTGETALTDLGDAAVDSERALALAREASAAAAAARARASDATADLRGRTDPNRARTTTSGRTPSPAAAASNPAVASEDTPPPGARKAPDGKWYVPDPARPGKWLLWTP